MTVTYIVDQRDSQGQVIALPAFTTMIGLSSDTKPSVDSGGKAKLKVGSEFWERDTNDRYVWNGQDWEAVISQETKVLREISQQNTALLKVLVSLHNGMVLAETSEAELIEVT